MKQTIIISSEELRNRAAAILAALPLDPVHEVVFRPSKDSRSLAQNAKMWSVLAEVSEQVEWHGVRLTKEEWKDVFTAALKKQKVVPGIDGGFVVIGARTSQMSIAEMSDVIECATAFGTQQGVKWKYYGDE